MARVLWLADALRAAGLTVVEHDGWKSRGFQPWQPRFGIVHATAAPRSQSDATQVAIVRDGHSTLRGPIANAVVDRSGRWHVVASGQCNTALTGWAGPAEGLGNEHLLGIEACNDNRGEPWPDAQYQAYVRGWAAICTRMGWGAQRCVGHKEHQPGNKSDPSFDMGTFRRRVAVAIEGDDVSAADVWQHELKRPDGENRPAGRLHVWGNWASFQGRDAARESRDLGRENAAKLDALLAAQGGEDSTDAFREALAQHRQLQAAERRAEHAELAETLGPALAAELRSAAADLPEEAAEAVAGIVDGAVERALGRTSLVVEPAGDEPA